MNVDTGEIRKLFSEEQAEELFKDPKWVEVEESDMTEKQKLNSQVSLHDNKSKLGKLRVKESTLRNRRKRQRKRGLK